MTTAEALLSRSCKIAITDVCLRGEVRVRSGAALKESILQPRRSCNATARRAPDRDCRAIQPSPRCSACKSVVKLFTAAVARVRRSARSTTPPAAPASTSGTVMSCGVSARAELINVRSDLARKSASGKATSWRRSRRKVDSDIALHRRVARRQTECAFPVHPSVACC